MVGGPRRIDLGLDESHALWASPVIVWLHCTLAIINFLQRQSLQASPPPPPEKRKHCSRVATALRGAALVRMLAAGFLCLVVESVNTLDWNHWGLGALHPPSSKTANTTAAALLG